MKKIFIVVYILSVCLTFALITTDSFAHKDVTIKFPGEIKAFEYEGKPAFSIDISFYPDTLFRPREIELIQIELVIIKLTSDGYLYESKIKPYAYNSRMLNKIVKVGFGKTVPYERDADYRIPETISGFELESKIQENGSLLYLLPEEWNLVWKIQWGKDFSRIYDDNKYINIYPYSASGIAGIFKDYRIMTPNLEKLYDVYRYISAFEDMNESLKKTW